ncbi:hypothetical protein [Nocardioides sp. Leaf374]|uniref:hypothetical protein n=1 Tax=Nocardioides sp. Leaf374 TaxID=2876560 RepID=UPI001E48C27C|nr:hypothetical protein [Nocardioides sp. Leaf374]
MTVPTAPAPDRLYVEVAGTNCYIAGTPGVVAEVVRDLDPRRVPCAAFVQLDLGPMLYVTLGRAVGDREQWREVVVFRQIDRDEFDRLTELAQLRHEMGWRDPVATPPGAPQ